MNIRRLLGQGDGGSESDKSNNHNKVSKSWTSIKYERGFMLADVLLNVNKQISKR